MIIYVFNTFEKKYVLIHYRNFLMLGDFEILRFLKYDGFWKKIENYFRKLSLLFYE